MLIPVSSQLMSIDQFHADLHEVCGSFDVVRADEQRNVRGHVGLEHRAGLEIAHIAKDVQSVRRTSQDIKRSDSHNFFLIVQEEGQAMMQQAGTTRVMKAGDMILVDSALPSEFVFFGKFSRQLSVHLPRDSMIERFGAAATGGHYVQKADFHTVAMTAILAKVFSQQTNDTQKAYLKDAVYGLLGAILYERAADNDKSAVEVHTSGLALAEQGMAYIDRCFDDETLGTQAVADALGVPLRQLQRAFSGMGTTASDYLMKKRFERACHLLRHNEDHSTAQLISSIAYACGFNDVSYFNRQFRKRFGCSPSQFRSEG